MKSKYTRSLFIIALVGGFLLIMLFATRPKWLSPNVVVARQNLLHSRKDAPTPQTPAQANAPDIRAAPTGPLKVEYVSPAPKIAELQPDPTPPPGKAEVVVGEKTISPPNYSGSYERVAVRSGVPVPVRVSWPEDTISAGVYVDAIQGGKIDGQKSKGFDFRNGKTIRFDFTASEEAGLYQVVLRRGTTEEILDFWVPTNRPEKDPHALN